MNILVNQKDKESKKKDTNTNTDIRINKDTINKDKKHSIDKKFFTKTILNLVLEKTCFS